MFEFPYDFIIYINSALILLFLFLIYRGYKRGLLLQLMGLVTTFASLIIAWIFSDVGAMLFSFVRYEASGLSKIDSFIGDYANRLIWFVILFVLIRIALMMLTPIASLISKLPLVKQVNSAVGAAFGAVQFVVYLVLLVLFLGLPVVSNGQDIIDKTALKVVNEKVVPLIGFVEAEFNKNQMIQSLIRNKGLSADQKRDLVELLMNNGFTSEEIREFLSSYE